MKSRALLVVAAVVLVAAAALWFWPAPAEPLAPSSPGAPSPAKAAATPQKPTAPSPTPASSLASTRAPVATPPPAIASSVIVGGPMVRSTPRPAPSKAAAPPAGTATAPVPKDPDGAREMEDVRLMFRNYLTRLGENPVGSNAEIMKAMMGRNSAAAKLGPPPGQSMNADGELLDFWGTPYFFHQLARDKMEVRSAGPDKRMWTLDDLVAK